MERKIITILYIITCVVIVNGCNAIVNEETPTSTVTDYIENINTETPKPIVQKETGELLYNLDDIIADTSLREQIANDLGKSTDVSVADLNTINFIDITDDVTSLDGLEMLTSLRSVDVYLTNYNTVDYEKLKKLKSLSSIGLYFNGYIYGDDTINTSILDELEKMECYDKVYIHSTSTFDGNILAGFDNVKRVDINTYAELEHLDLSGMSDMESLEYLDLMNNINFESFEGLDTLVSLKSLNLRGCYNFVDIDSVIKLKNLEYLDLWGDYLLTAEDFNKLSELVKLKELWIGMMCAPNTKLIDLEFTESLPELEIISIEAERYENLEALTRLDNLKYVVIVLSDEQQTKHIDLITGLEEKGVGVTIHEP